MKRRDFIAMGVAHTAGLLALQGCMGREIAAKAAEHNILLFGNDTDPGTLDPHLCTTFTEHRVMTALWEGLTSLDPADLSVVPGVAESWDISEDGLTYTFHLRQDARWSNGDPLTANDFIYAWRRILTPMLAAEYSYMLHVIRGAAEYNAGDVKDFSEVGAKALDDHTLEVKLAWPAPYLLSMQNHFTWFPVHPPTIERFDAMEHRDTKWTEPENIVTNGPYRMVAWVPDVEIRAVRNTHYWNSEAVSIDEVDFLPYGGKMMTLERSFRLGKLHLAVDLPISKIQVYQRDYPELLNIHDFLGCYFYRFNTTRPPFTDARIRRAFAMAIDCERIVKEVTRGGERPARNLVPPNTAGYTCKSTIPYDVEAARQLLADAGYPSGKGLPPIDLLYNTSENHQLIAESIQHMFQEAFGVRVVLRNQDAKVYFDSMKQLDYGMCRSAWIGDYLDPINFLECFETGGGNNRTGWSSQRFDSLLSQARLSPDTGERDGLYQQAEGLLMSEAPIAPVYFYTQRLLKRPEVQGWKPNIQAHIDYKYLRLAPGKE